MGAKDAVGAMSMGYEFGLRAMGTTGAVGAMCSVGAIGGMGYRCMLGLKIAKTPDLYTLWKYKACQTWIL